MTTADRQASERELLDDYRRALASAAVPTWTATSCGTAIGRAPCTPTSRR